MKLKNKLSPRNTYRYYEQYIFASLFLGLQLCFHFCSITAQKMKFSIQNFFSKFDQIRRFLRILSHLLKKSLMENFIFCAVYALFYVTPVVFRVFKESVNSLRRYILLNILLTCFVFLKRFRKLQKHQFRIVGNNCYSDFYKL